MERTRDRETTLSVAPSLRLSVSPSSGRRGITLYEVVLATVIFLGAFAVLGQVISTGSRAAVQSRLHTQAVVRCQSQLGEVLAGVVPLQPVDNSAFEDGAAGWTWSLAVNTGPHVDLVELEVTAAHANSQGLVDASCTLRRYVRDPQLFLDAAAAAAESVSSEGTAP